jgi:hypothetical protein
MSFAMAALEAKSAVTLGGGGGGGAPDSMPGSDPEATTAPSGLIEWSSFMSVPAVDPGPISQVKAQDHNTGCRRASDRATRSFSAWGRAIDKAFRV